MIRYVLLLVFAFQPVALARAVAPDECQRSDVHATIGVELACCCENEATCTFTCRCDVRPGSHNMPPWIPPAPQQSRLGELPTLSPLLFVLNDLAASYPGQAVPDRHHLPPPTLSERLSVLCQWLT